jgi:hypothetical protein
MSVGGGLAAHTAPRNAMSKSLSGRSSARKFDDEGRALALTLALRTDRAPLKFDQRARDRESETEPAKSPRDVRLALLEGVEDARKHIGPSQHQTALYAEETGPVVIGSIPG